MVHKTKSAIEANIFGKVQGKQAKNLPEKAEFFRKYTVHMVHKWKFARKANIFDKVHGTRGTQA